MFDSWTLHFFFLYYIILIIITITVTESIGCLLDFRWVCPLECHWCLMVISSRLDADLLLVHWKSIGKVCWTDKSDQKCPDKQWKLTGKLQHLHNRRISILTAQSPMESGQSLLGKAVAVYRPPSCRQSGLMKLT